MAGIGQCFISAGAGIQLLWSCAADGSPVVTIRCVPGAPSKLEKDTGFAPDISGQWSYAEDPETSRATVTYDLGQSKASQGADSSRSTDEFEGRLGTIWQRIDRHWTADIEYIRQYHRTWMSDISSFFRTTSNHPSAEYSFRCLCATTDRQRERENVFHKLSLANELKRRVGQEAAIHVVANIRKSMLSEICPEFLQSSKQRQVSLQRTFNYTVQEGTFLAMLENCFAGSALTVGPRLARTDILFLSNHFRIPCRVDILFEERRIRESRAYAEICRRISAWLSADPASSKEMTGLESRIDTRLNPSGLVKLRKLHIMGFPNLASVLFEFYVNNVCSGRTVLRTNAYFDEFLPILQGSENKLTALLALSASYLKELFAPNSVQRHQVELAELQLCTEAGEEIYRAVTQRDLGPVTSVMAALQCHHATLNPSMYPSCWSKYRFPMLDHGASDLEASLAVASVDILAMTALPAIAETGFRTWNYDWICCGDARRLTCINSTLGLSRGMLFLIHSITQEAKAVSAARAAKLLAAIDASPMWVDEREHQMAAFIAMATGETYRLSARLYCLTRLFSYTPRHPDVKQTCSELIGWLKHLPTEGDWYSSIHPAWCCVMACICTCADEDHRSLVQELDHIAGSNKSNVEDCCSLVRKIRGWQRSRWADSDANVDLRWWEAMVEHCEGNVIVCLA